MLKHQINKLGVLFREWLSSIKKTSSTDELECRITVDHSEKDGSEGNTFKISLFGNIRVSNPNQKVTAEIFINDKGLFLGDSQPVYSKTGEWKLENSEIFCFCADLGRLPSTETVLSDWTEIAQIKCDWLELPRKGLRCFQLLIHLFSCDDGQRIARTECFFEYENPSLGYIDKRENMQRACTMAIPLAFAVSAVDKKLYQSEIKVIRDWAANRFNVDDAAMKTRNRIEKKFHKMFLYVKAGNQINVQKLCRTINAIAEVGQRYDILQLCLQVAGAKGWVVTEEIDLLHQLGNSLNVDREIYQAMQEKLLPVTMHDKVNAISVLGLEEGATQKATQIVLNKEFKKWNSRVTNSNPEIRKQADYMLNLIAQARNQYIN